VSPALAAITASIVTSARCIAGLNALLFCSASIAFVVLYMLFAAGVVMAIQYLRECAVCAAMLCVEVVNTGHHFSRSSVGAREIGQDTLTRFLDSDVQLRGTG
jgi:hypothetical protein